MRQTKALKVLKLASSAGGLNDLAFLMPAVDISVWPLYLQLQDNETVLAGEDNVLSKAACTALRLIAAQDAHSPPTSDYGWLMLQLALSCTTTLCVTALVLLVRLARLANKEQPAACNKAAAKGERCGVALVALDALRHGPEA
jgi:cytochrome c-type biogenesis protein CcmH/NrfG